MVDRDKDVEEGVLDAEQMQRLQRPRPTCSGKPAPDGAIDATRCSSVLFVDVVWVARLDACRMRWATTPAVRSSIHLDQGSVSAVSARYEQRIRTHLAYQRIASAQRGSPSRTHRGRASR